QEGGQAVTLIRREPLTVDHLVQRCLLCGSQVLLVPERVLQDGSLLVIRQFGCNRLTDDPLERTGTLAGRGVARAGVDRSGGHVVAVFPGLVQENAEGQRFSLGGREGISGRGLSGEEAHQPCQDRTNRTQEKGARKPLHVVSLPVWDERALQSRF